MLKEPVITVNVCGEGIEYDKPQLTKNYGKTQNIEWNVYHYKLFFYYAWPFTASTAKSNQ